jgi:hypothetical protein
MLPDVRARFARRFIEIARNDLRECIYSSKTTAQSGPQLCPHTSTFSAAMELALARHVTAVAFGRQRRARFCQQSTSNGLGISPTLFWKHRFDAPQILSGNFAIVFIV